MRARNWQTRREKRTQIFDEISKDDYPADLKGNEGNIET